VTDVPHRIKIIPPEEPALQLIAACYEFYVDDRLVYPSSVIINLDAAKIITVTLTLPLAIVATLEGRANVIIAPETADTLIGLGWVPPPDQ
jgi:hypothetical protein